jgi:hypothetical protein
MDFDGRFIVRLSAVFDGFVFAGSEMNQGLGREAPEHRFKTDKRWLAPREAREPHEESARMQEGRAFEGDPREDCFCDDGGKGGKMGRVAETPAPPASEASHAGGKPWEIVRRRLEPQHRLGGIHLSLRSGKVRQ